MDPQIPGPRDKGNPLGEWRPFLVSRAAGWVRLVAGGCFCICLMLSVLEPWKGLLDCCIKQTRESLVVQPPLVALRPTQQAGTSR